MLSLLYGFTVDVYYLTVQLSSLAHSHPAMRVSLTTYSNPSLALYIRLHARAPAQSSMGPVKVMPRTVHHTYWYHTLGAVG